MQGNAVARRRFGSTNCSSRLQELDSKFDAGEDITGALDYPAASRPRQEARRVNVDFRSWMVESLNREAQRIGVTRHSVIKVCIAERLEHKAP